MPSLRFIEFVNANHLITGDDLALELGLKAGVPQYVQTNWLHYKVHNQSLYVTQKPIRHSVSWFDLYKAGAVYTKESDDHTVLDRWPQDAEVSINGSCYRVTLLKGATSPHINSVPGHSPTWAKRSEWNHLLYGVHRSESFKDRRQGFERWGKLSDADLHTHYTQGNGIFCWCQESTEDGLYRVGRGDQGVTYAGLRPPETRHQYVGWRPVLREVI